MPKEAALPGDQNLAEELDALIRDGSLSQNLRRFTILAELQRDFLMGQFPDLQVADYTEQDTQELAGGLKQAFPDWKASMAQSLRTSEHQDWVDAADLFDATVTLETLGNVVDKDLEFFRKRSGEDIVLSNEVFGVIEKSLAYWLRVREIISAAQDPRLS